MRIVAFFLCSLLLVVCSNAIGQIRLPKGFRCVLGEHTPNEAYFTDGSFTFRSYPWGHDGLSGKEAIQAIEKGQADQVKFQQTKDGLYWATGKVNGTYVYIVLVDEVLQFTLRSATNSRQFAEYSAWMLGQIRSNIASGKSNYFTDYRGTSCYGRR